MAQLLESHPQYLPSLKRLAKISGSTSDPYISSEILSHLKKGLEATGLLEQAEQEQFPSGKAAENAAEPTGLRGLLKRLLAVKPVEATPAESARRPLPTTRAAGFNTPVPLEKGSSPRKKRRALLANWSKEVPIDKEDDLEC